MLQPCCTLRTSQSFLLSEDLEDFDHPDDMGEFLLDFALFMPGLLNLLLVKNAFKV